MKCLYEQAWCVLKAVRTNGPERTISCAVGSEHYNNNNKESCAQNNCDCKHSAKFMTSGNYMLLSLPCFTPFNLFYFCFPSAVCTWPLDFDGFFYLFSQLDISHCLMSFSFNGTGFWVPLSSIYVYHCWRTVPPLLWLFFSFLSLFSSVWFQDLELDWKQRLEYSFQWLFSEFWKMSPNLIISKRW